MQHKKIAQLYSPSYNINIYIYININISIIIIIITQYIINHYYILYSHIFPNDMTKHPSWPTKVLGDPFPGGESQHHRRPGQHGVGDRGVPNELLSSPGAFYVGNGWVAGGCWDYWSMGCWGLLGFAGIIDSYCGWLLIVVDHSQKFPFSTSTIWWYGYCRSQTWYALRPIGPQILVHRASNLKHPYGTDFGRCLVGGVPNFDPYPHDMDMMLWYHGKIVWACLTISSLRILKVVLSRNWRYGWYTLKWQFSWTNMLILILVFWCKKPWSSWARRLATTWSSGMVVCLASLTSWRRSEDVIMQMVWVWYHGKI